MKLVPESQYQVERLRAKLHTWSWISDMSGEITMDTPSVMTAGSW